jgi:hypothetical protein
VTFSISTTFMWGRIITNWKVFWGKSLSHRERDLDKCYRLLAVTERVETPLTVNV